MAKKMLIDATHAEETRVVVVDGNKVEEFDFESENKRQLAGNIYLAKVTRVEPSLQAAFVDYGGNRHGFLAFSEIHPDYYQIPVADREALLAEEMEYAKQQEEEEEREKPKRSRRRRSSSRSRSQSVAAETASDDAVETKEVDAASPEATEESAASVSGMDVVEPESSEADDLIAEGNAPVEEGTSPALPLQRLLLRNLLRMRRLKRRTVPMQTPIRRMTPPMRMALPRPMRGMTRKPHPKKMKASKALLTMTPSKRSVRAANRVRVATKFKR